jgi:hypothetical protein
MVLNYEKERLTSLGKADLANLIVHVSVIEGDGAGYDIRSFKEDGTPLFIEVKSTRGEIDAPFFITSSEIEFSETHGESYCLVRVFNLQEDGAHFFRLNGKIKEKLQLNPTNYRATLLSY